VTEPSPTELLYPRVVLRLTALRHAAQHDASAVDCDDAQSQIVWDYREWALEVWLPRLRVRAARHRPRGAESLGLVSWAHCGNGCHEVFRDLDAGSSIGPARFPCADFRDLCDEIGVPIPDAVYATLAMSHTSGTPEPDPAPEPTEGPQP
jgi:hypothetical protein